MESKQNFEEKYRSMVIKNLALKGEMMVLKQEIDEKNKHLTTIREQLNKWRP